MVRSPFAFVLSALAGVALAQDAPAPFDAYLFLRANAANFVPATRWREVTLVEPSIDSETVYRMHADGTVDIYNPYAVDGNIYQCNDGDRRRGNWCVSRARLLAWRHYLAIEVGGEPVTLLHVNARGQVCTYPEGGLGIEAECEAEARGHARALFAADPVDDRRPDTGDGTVVPSAAQRKWLNDFVAGFALDATFPCRADDATADCLPPASAGRGLLASIAPLAVEGARGYRAALGDGACFIPDYDEALGPAWEETVQGPLLNDVATPKDDEDEQFLLERYRHRETGTEVAFVERVAGAASCVREILFAIPPPAP